MRNMKLHTICTLVITAALNANAGIVSVDPNMEAKAGCEVINCMVPVEPTIASAQAVELKGYANQAAKLVKVNVFTESKINEVPREKFPQFDGIGLVQRVSDLEKIAYTPNARVPFANAINIAPCTVITNYHVNNAKLAPQMNKTNTRLRFSVGYSSSAPFDQQSEITPIIGGDRDSNDYSANNDPACSGAKYGYYKVSNKTRYDLVKERAKVMVASFDPTGKLTISMGTVTGIDPDTGYVMFSGSTKPGSSSAAVFVVDDETGELRLQGINKGAKGSDYTNYNFDKYSDEKANLFMSMEQVFAGPDIRQRVIDDIQAHPGVNPLDKHVKLRK